MKKTKTTITPEILSEVETLAAKGFNNIQISRSLNIGRQTLSTNRDLKESIQKGRLALSKIVTESVLDTLDTSPANQQLLIKRLGLFMQPIHIIKPTNAKQALSNLAAATKQYSQGLISESQLRTIEATTNSYIKGYEISNLEERISKLEKAAQ